MSGPGKHGKHRMEMTITGSEENKQFRGCFASHDGIPIGISFFSGDGFGSVGCFVLKDYVNLPPQTAKTAGQKWYLPYGITSVRGQAEYLRLTPAGMVF